MAYSTPDALSTTQVLTTANYNKIRDSVIADCFMVFPLGGSRSNAIPNGGGYQVADAAIDFQLPDSASTGGVWKLVVEVVTENAATTVTPRLYNTTDASATWTGSAGTATAFGSSAEQISTALTVTTGKRYQLQFTKSDDVYACWGIGYLRRTAS